MDYQGDYFPEDRDERESNVYRIVKNVFKWSMYACSLVVWVLVIYFIIVNGDKDIVKENHITDISGYENLDTDKLLLYRVNPRVFMDEEASLQVYNVDYAPDFGLLEMGVRFNSTKLTDGDNGDVLRYVLSDSDGNVYEMINKITQKSGRNGYARICFSGVNIDLNSNDLKYAGENGEPRTDTVYTLSVLFKPQDAEEETELYLFTIYNNNTVFYETDYNEG